MWTEQLLYIAEIKSESSCERRYFCSSIICFVSFNSAIHEIAFCDVVFCVIQPLPLRSGGLCYVVVAFLDISLFCFPAAEMFYYSGCILFSLFRLTIQISTLIARRLVRSQTVTTPT